MGLAYGREIELVLQIVWINEIVGDPVCQHEIPREIASANGLNRETLRTRTRRSRPY